MFTTKKQVDQHVKTSLAKLRSENEKRLRGLVIAKMYFKIGEYASALHYVSGYLTSNESHSQAHRLLGDCYSKLRQPEKALPAYQRSYQLDKKQTDLLIEACNLILNEDVTGLKSNAKFWCEAAASARVQHESVFNLKLKLLAGDEHKDTRQVEEMIVKEVNSRPSEVSPRLQLVNYYLAKGRTEDAFKYVSDIMTRNPAQFLHSLEWYAAVHRTLQQYRQAADVVLSKNWDYWVLALTAVDRQLALSLAQEHPLASQQSGHLLHCQSLLCELDQLLYTAANISFPVRAELSAQLLNHFQGQFLLHAAAFLYARERNTSQWWTTINHSLPLLFVAFRLGIASTEDAWLKQTTEATRELVRLWQRQGAFRCSQAGRTLLSCVQEEERDGKAPRNGAVAPFKSPEDVTDAARKHCASRNWTTTLHRHLFTQEEHASKNGTSFLATSNLLAEPTFEMPSVLRVQMYERIAEHLQSDSLAQLVYLYLHAERLADCDFHVFSGLELTTANIFNCGAATLSQLDVETFLIATVQQTKSRLACDVRAADGPRPLTLPYVNMAHLLCTEEQRRWWQCAFSSTQGTSAGEEPSNVREVLQDGIEAVRCVGTPKMDLMVALLTGDVLKQKVDGSLSIDLATKKAYGQRVENIFQCALHWFKHQATAAVADKRRLFQYHSKGPVLGTEECEALLEGAVIYLAEHHFRQADYETCIEVLTNVQLPYATYYIAEAYKKMDEAHRTNNRTPSRSGGGPYQGKVKQYLGQTQKLLAANAQKTHSLRTVVSNELKKLQFGDLNASTASVDDDTLNLSYPTGGALNRSTRQDNTVVADQVSALTALVTQLTMQNTMLQTEMSDIKKMLQQQKETTSLNDSLFRLEEQQQRLLQHHSPHYDYMNAGRFSMGGAGAFPYGPQGLPFPGTPGQYPPAHMRGMYGADPNAMAMAQHGVMPTYDPVTGTMVLPPQAVAAQSFYPNAVAQSPIVAPPPQTQQHHQAPPPQQQPQSLLANQLQQPPLASSSTVEQVFGGGNSILKSWNSTYNNEPVEKGAPANVVITNSDPVPAMHNSVPAPKLLSVTIPPQHIKNYGAKASDAANHGGAFGAQSSTLSHTATNISGDETATEEDYYDEQGNSYNEEPEPVTPVMAKEPPKKTEPVKAVPEVKFGFGAASTTPAAAAAGDSAAAKPSPFSNFSFGKPAATASPEKPFSGLFGAAATQPASATAATPEKPFASLFGSLPKPAGTEGGLFGFSSTPSTTTNNTPAKPKEAPATAASPKADNNDDAEDEYVPTAQFKPVIELPSLIEVKTGEEDENCTFEHRAKLLRFDTTTKEWKERGLGNIRVMVRKDDPSQVRLLMRREQVLKLACNQRVSKDQVFQKMPNSQTALTWYAQDFAENELKTELFAIRFKTSETCQAFHDAVLAAQRNMKDKGSVEVVKAPATATNAEEKKGFGDQFKKQLGSWECNGCLVVNKSDTLYCVACDAPKDDTVPKKETKPKGVDLSGVKPGQFTFGFGAKPVVPVAAATPTETAQNLAMPKKEAPAAAPAPVKPTVAEPVKGFGDAFKPKAGSWECQACYITNKADVDKCVSCATNKDGKPDETGNKLGGGGLNFASAAAAGGGFSFGMGTKPAFSFGSTPAPAAPPTTNGSPFANLFGTAATPAPTAGGLFGQPATSTTSANGPSFGLDSKPTFDFVFKPKSPGKVKSPQKMANGAAGHEDDGGSDDEHVEEEENTAYFTPVIPLPDKVEAKTGEEEEEVLYSHRAKLFRFTDGEWKERGLGDVKVLKHRVSGKLRVVMRREQVLKICLNHALDGDVEYKAKDNKSWSFVANDFSEGVLELMQFSIRFKTPEIANEFMDAVNAARGGAADDTVVEQDEKASGDGLTPEQKTMIKTLRLPNDFFSYDNAEPCPGCRGCSDEAFVFPAATPISEHAHTLALKMPPLPTARKPTAEAAKNIFGAFNQSLNTSANTGASLFGSGNAFSASPQPTTTTSIFGGAAFGQPAQPPAFGATPATTTPTTEQAKPSIFGGLGSTATGTTGSTAPVFGSKPVFGAALGTSEPAKDSTTTSGSIFGQKSIFGAAATATNPAATGGSTFGSFNFGTASLNPPEKPAAAPEEEKKSEGNNLFKMDSNFSFASLAQQEPGSVFNAKPATTGGFFGLSNTNDFKHFNNPGAAAAQANGNGDAEDESVDDANYDPHYEPIIALPEEISVSTGEEEETKLFGERGRLYRFDATNKEWKERGVGEFKVLHHPGKGTYRFVMRREQIFKLVLNHAISADFDFKPLDKSGKAFCWGAMNHAEQPGQLEQLAVRFKNTDLAAKCEEAVKNCISNMQD